MSLDPDELLIFFRADGFYPINVAKGVPLADQAREQAEINPGTIRVEDARGNVLWRVQ